MLSFVKSVTIEKGRCTTIGKQLSNKFVTFDITYWHGTCTTSTPERKTKVAPRVDNSVIWDIDSVRKGEQL